MKIADISQHSVPFQHQPRDEPLRNQMSDNHYEPDEPSHAYQQEQQHHSAPA